VATCAVSPDRIDRRTVLRAGALAAAGPLLAACGAMDNLLAVDVVRVAVSWSDAELAAFQSVLDVFRQRTQYEVDVIPLGDDIADAVTSQVNGRPDIVMLPRVGLVGQNSHRLAPLPAGTWHDDWLASSWRDVVSVDGGAGGPTPYGLPFKVANQSVLWYRQDVFDDLGLAPPATWSAWLAVNDTLLRHGITPLALGAGDGWPLEQFFANVLRGCQPDVYRRLATSDPPVDLWQGAGFGQALRLLGGMLSVEGVLSGGVERSLVMQYPDSIVEVFGYHNAAMVVSADFAGPVIDEFRRPPARVGAIPFPVVDGVPAERARADEQDLVIGRNGFPTDHPLVIGADVAVLLAPVRPGARALVNWLATPEAPLPWITGHGGFIAANRRTDLGAYGPVVKTLAAAVADTGSLTFDLSDSVGALGGSGGLFPVLEDFLRAVGDGHPDRVGPAAATAARRMHDTEVAHGR
jgi:alpha-glucoside transport system substrate-binding protein